MHPRILDNSNTSRSSLRTIPVLQQAQAQERIKTKIAVDWAFFPILYFLFYTVKKVIVEALSNDYFIFASFLTTIFFCKNVMTYATGTR
jgi:hypothetical protein